MATTAAEQPAIIPPRPSRSQDKDLMPKIPPRPLSRRLDRSVSPSNPDRYAPSPLNDGPFLPVLSSSPRSRQFMPYTAQASDPVDRSKSVDLPSVGQEGQEYAGLTEELGSEQEPLSSPEQTRIIGDDVQLHAPKPSLPAQSAKARVAAVTRTDSDKAAAYGIGKPSVEEPFPSNRSLKKKASTVSQLSTSESHVDDEQGIPEIGQQVPMYPNAGDVQAPSPAPGPEAYIQKPKNHSRRTSARGFVELPPGSYGLHGHGVLSQDKLEKAYYDKHPELRYKEHTPHHHDRTNDFSMSSDDLNKIVHDTAGRGSGNGHAPAFAPTPAEHVGWQAIEETTSRVSSTRPQSTDVVETGPHGLPPPDAETVHIDDAGGRRRSVMFSDDEDAIPEEVERPYTAPILAEDEVAKHPAPEIFEPAVDLPPERRGSAFEIETPPRSRPTSRPASIYKDSAFDVHSTPLEDVQEYEPLFPEEEKGGAAKSSAKPAKRDAQSYKPRFPSRDVWEDAPNSLNYTAEVSTPEPAESVQKPPEVPTRDSETPAHMFALQQEELAEKELSEPENLQGQRKKSIFAHQQPLQLTAEPTVASSAPRFPSRDIWEDTPDSLQLQATVSHLQQTDDASPVDTRPQVPQRPVKKMSDPSTAPAVPERPKRKTSGSEEAKSATTKSPPTIPDRPKPQIPARPTKAGPTSEGREPADAAAPPPKTKPAVPVRPVGSKIAALQAGFMSDLNKRLQLGPQAPKKEEPSVAESDETEKAPLADARKGRARGPQRRAPKSSPSPASGTSGAAEVTRERPVLSFSSTCTVFSVDPDSDHVTISSVALEDGDGDYHKEPKPTESQEVEAEKTLAPAEEKEEEEEREEAGDDSAQAPQHEEHEEVKTLATNTAGESLVEAHIAQDAEENVTAADAVEEGEKE